MDRKEFTQKLLALGACPFMLANFNGLDNLGNTENPDEDEKTKAIRSEKEFIENWLRDFMDTMDKILDTDTEMKSIEGCGRGCFDRHQFKKDMADRGLVARDDFVIPGRRARGWIVVAYSDEIDLIVAYPHGCSWNNGSQEQA